MIAKDLENRVKKIVLLNPPGKLKYQRDMYCSCVSKAKYYYHPIDLLFLSGMLSKDYIVYVVDAIAEELSPPEAKKRITAYRPDFLLSLVSAPSFKEDTAFLKDLAKALPKTVFIATGDIYRGFRERSFRFHPFLDAVLTDFSTEDILHYLDGSHLGKIIDNVIYRYKNKIYNGPEKHGVGDFHIPVPRWELFPIEKYSFPFSKKGKFARIMTDFGCPFGCTFCPGGSLGYKLRDLDTVIQEMRLVKRLGISELYMADFTFGVHKERTFELLMRMREEGFNFSWTAFSRVDVLSKELLSEMKKTGCHTIMMGIESANEQILKEYRKNIKNKQMMAVVRMAKENKMAIMGTFMIGLPGESRESILATIDFATKIGIDYASFNITTARFGTQFREEMIKKGYIKKDDLALDSTWAKPQWIKGSISNEEIWQLQKLAVRKFYLRPGYLLHRLLMIRSRYELKQQIEEGIALIRGK